jgi:hypothetical protein
MLFTEINCNPSWLWNSVWIELTVAVILLLLHVGMPTPTIVVVES